MYSKSFPQKTSVSIVPASPNPSISTISTSQQSQQLVDVSQSSNTSHASNALALFRAEAEKEFADHTESTLASLQMFKKEMIRANEKCNQF